MGCLQARPPSLSIHVWSSHVSWNAALYRQYPDLLSGQARNLSWSCPCSLWGHVSLVSKPPKPPRLELCVIRTQSVWCPHGATGPWRGHLTQQQALTGRSSWRARESGLDRTGMCTFLVGKRHDPCCSLIRCPPVAGNSVSGH